MQICINSIINLSLFKKMYIQFDIKCIFIYIKYKRFKILNVKIDWKYFFIFYKVNILFLFK